MPKLDHISGPSGRLQPRRRSSYSALHLRAISVSFRSTSSCPQVLALEYVSSKIFAIFQLCERQHPRLGRSASRTSERSLLPPRWPEYA